MKRLETTVDFYDDLWAAGREYTPENVDQMLEFISSIGVRKVDWYYDTFWTYYRRHFAHKKNVIAYAVEKAHSLGMELHAVIKPFETGLSHMFVPNTFPNPKDRDILEDITGYLYHVDPFAAKNPYLRFKRKPGNWNTGGAVKTIKLVSINNQEVHIKPEDLEIWTGEKNGQLEEYKDGFVYSQSTEWRSLFPVGQECKVITLDNLNIATEKKYILVKCKYRDEKGTFYNTIQDIMEIYDEKGNIIPSTPAVSEISLKPIKYLLDFPSNEYCDYAGSREVREFVSDPENIRKAIKDSYVYGQRQGTIFTQRILDKDGYAGVARGKNEYLAGVLSPVYKEVQDYWLGLVNDCINLGVDGVIIRVASHSCNSIERDEYGFNEPVLKKCGDRIDRDLVNEINGKAFTAFLRKAGELLKKHGLRVGIHINAEYVYPDDRPCPNHDKIPPNIEWEWEKWIKEIADEIYLKDMHMVTEAHADHFIDKVTRVAKSCNKPTIYVGTNKEVRFSGNYSRVEYEINKVLENTRIDGYNLYEVFKYTRMDKNGQIEGSPGLAKLLKKYFT